MPFSGNAIDYGGCIGVECVWTERERCNEVDNLSETIHFRDFFHATSSRIE